MNEATRQLVRRRAAGRCEFCRLPQALHDERFSIDHVIARKHGGGDGDDNLALCCLRCNLHKGTDLTAIDPETGSVTPLFNPRHQSWGSHFRLNGAVLVGLSPAGRATIALLKMNAVERVRIREALIAEGIFHMDD